MISRAGTLKAENSIGSDDGQGKDGAKNDFVGKSDHNVDNLFIEDVRSFRLLSYFIFCSAENDRVIFYCTGQVSNRIPLWRRPSADAFHGICHQICEACFEI